MTNKNIILLLLSVFFFASCEEKLGEEFEEVFSTESSIASFNVENSKGIIDEENAKISLVVPPTLDIASLAPDVLISRQATVEPASGVAQDFTNILNYEVTAKDGQTKSSYEVSAVNDIISFSINGVELNIDRTSRVISGELPLGADVTKIIPEINIHSTTTISPASGEEIDLSNPVYYTIQSKNGFASVSYKVMLSKVYYISTWQDLQNIKNDLVGKYYITADIVFPNPGLEGFPATGFEPIGSLSNPFTGILEGDGHYIRNFFIDKVSSSEPYTGFFGVSAGKVHNVFFEHDDGGHHHIKGYGPVGTIAGLQLAGGEIINCHVIGRVASVSSGGDANLVSYPASELGALVGWNDGGINT